MSQCLFSIPYTHTQPRYSVLWGSYTVFMSLEYFEWYLTFEFKDVDTSDGVFFNFSDMKMTYVMCGYGKGNELRR
jgi:hypothetical protein